MIIIIIIISFYSFLLSAYVQYNSVIIYNDTGPLRANHHNATRQFGDASLCARISPKRVRRDPPGCLAASVAPGVGAAGVCATI